MAKNIVQGSLITTFRCNAKCNMCNIWKHQTRPEEEIDASYYEKLPAGLRINITGGECTIRKDIDKIFEILYPKSSLLELSTNGYNTETIVALANKYPNILIRVSVEGLPALNDKKRGTLNGFDHALRTMLELKKTKCKNIGFSVVISPDNYKDLLHLYELCVALDVELGNSVVHNSWYFHKDDNQLESADALAAHEEFVKAMLTSKRRGLKNRLKDYGRAYFNRSIHRRLRGDEPGYRPPCGALTDFFFIDPWGNVSPCNGSCEEWIIGNIKEDSFENIMKSEKAPDSNITGTHDRGPLDKQVALIHEIQPNAKKVGIIYNSSEINSVIQADRLKKACQPLGIEVVELTVNSVNDVQQVAEGFLGGKVDAIFVPTDNIIASSIPTLMAVANKEKIPVYGAEVGHVKSGVLASESISFYDNGHRAGEMAAEILKGNKKVKDFPVEGADKSKLYINKAEMETLGITIPQSVLDRAEMM